MRENKVSGVCSAVEAGEESFFFFGWCEQGIAVIPGGCVLFFWLRH